MTRLDIASVLLAVAAGALGCSGDSTGTPPPTAGAGGTPAGGMTGEAGTGGAPAGGSGGAPSNAGSGGSAGSTFDDYGVCGARGQSPVTADTFEGYEEFYLISDDGFGVDICVVRFDVVRVGDAPAGCDDCAWTHRVEYRNPQVLTDVDGVCATSELGLDSARIDEIDGSQAAYGFVYEYSGHVSVLMKYDEMASTWGPNGNATWSEDTRQLRFDRRDGICGY